MTQHIESEQNKRLRNKFDFKKYGFYSVTPYIDAQIGFGCKKKLNPQDTKNVSGIGIYIPNKTYNEPSLTRKAFYITATYGEELPEGIRMRSEHNFLEPIDLEFRDEFFYDVNTEKLHKGNKEITANELLLEVYGKHIKTTRPFRGLFLRAKLRVWRIWLPWLFTLISNIFHYLLFFISGDKYAYEFLLQEENLNGQIISSRMKGRVSEDTGSAKTKEKEEEAKKIDFFGNKVPRWPIVFYSALHLCIWFLIKYFSIQTDQIEYFFSNNFLVVLYVIVSFWLIETVLPFLLKKLIKYSSTLSRLASHKKIKA
ncbi:hypothetical protein CL630_03520 [bacterium]|nr:hypothetical protein [bacterium]|tara:strand:+ start:2101 stop:3036 length:936 start_codon:yes stop_codon:yes gene_type:complete